MSFNAQNRFRLNCECLEARTMPSVWNPPAFAVAAPSPVLGQTAIVTTPVREAVHATSMLQPASLNSKIVTYLENKLGKQIGGGECAHIATEALRVAGAKFMRKVDSPGAGDYVWGTLVKKIEFAGGKRVDSAPGTPIKPGDIIQYRNATFSDGKKATHHTSVVAAVDSKGNVTHVFEQNVGKLVKGSVDQKRYVVKQSLDLKKLTGGWVRIYRAEARTPQAGIFEFTVTNNTTRTQTVSVQLGSKTWTYNLTADNTSGSFTTLKFTSSSNNPVLVVGGSKITVQDAAGYEVYKMSNGATGIRAI